MGTIYTGPHTQGSNTQYQKITQIDPQDHNPIPEVITHLLADE